MHVIKGRRAPSHAESRSTGRMQAQNLIDLIDKSAPDEGVVDMHEIEATFANGSRRIELVEPDDGAVVQAVPTDAADTTRRMSAVEADALVAVEIRSESTMRMCAIQESELVKLMAPTEIAIPQPPVVTFNAPKVALPLPAPAEDEVEVATAYEMPEMTVEPVVAPRRNNAWMTFAILALAAAAGALAYVNFAL